MSDVHIEFAHIYQDQPFGEEQIKSIAYLRKICNNLKKENKTYITSILIDDLNIQIPQWDLDELLLLVKKQGIKPDILVLESDFVKLGNLLIQKVPEKFLKIETFKKENKKVYFYDDGKNKFALQDQYENQKKLKCVVLSAAWLLCKLGIFPNPKECENIEGQSLITILPNRYQDVEKNVETLLFNLGYKEQMQNRVHYLFF